MTADSTENKYSLQTRLDFIGLNKAGLVNLKLLQKHLDNHLPAALDKFYLKLKTEPEVSRFFSDDAQMNGAKDRQISHWSRISAGKFDDDYMEMSNKVGNRHAQIGLEPRWYIGGYGLILETLVKNVVHDYMSERLATLKKPKPEQVMAEVDTMSGALVDVVKAVLIDVDIAISTYFDRLTLEARLKDEAAAQRVQRAVNLTGNVLRAYADGQLASRITEPFDADMQQIKDDTNAVGDQLTAVISQAQETSQALKVATGEILSGANDLSQRTTVQAATIEETSAAMEQLANTVAENARTAEEANDKAVEAAITAEEGGKFMARANEAMVQIKNSSDKISKVIGLIDQIAFQTNLLALNASVEAARAGEAGKGFAVVAIEVRRLAQSAAEASTEVKGFVEQSAREVVEGTRFVSEVSEKLTNLQTAVQDNAALMQQIAEASREQTSSIAEVNTAVRQLDEMTQHNAALVEETNAAIEQTESRANELDSIVEKFVLHETDFKRRGAA